MTFSIDWFEDIPRFGKVLRIKDETRYVQDIITEEQLVAMPQLDKYGKQLLMHSLLNVLCEKWYRQFGERIEPVAPEAEGVGWGIRHTAQRERFEEVTDAERPSIESGRHER